MFSVFLNITYDWLYIGEKYIKVMSINEYIHIYKCLWNFRELYIYIYIYKAKIQNVIHFYSKINLQIISKKEKKNLKYRN